MFQLPRLKAIGLAVSNFKFIQRKKTAFCLTQKVWALGCFHFNSVRSSGRPYAGAYRVSPWQWTYPVLSLGGTVRVSGVIYEHSLTAQHRWDTAVKVLSKSGILVYNFSLVEKLAYVPCIRLYINIQIPSLFPEVLSHVYYARLLHRRLLVWFRTVSFQWNKLGNIV